jgi:hypothetical protein
MSAENTQDRRTEIAKDLYTDLIRHLSENSTFTSALIAGIFNGPLEDGQYTRLKYKSGSYIYSLNIFRPGYIESIMLSRKKDEIGNNDSEDVSITYKSVDTDDQPLSFSYNILTYTTLNPDNSPMKAKLENTEEAASKIHKFIEAINSEPIDDETNRILSLRFNS